MPSHEIRFSHIYMNKSHAVRCKIQIPHISKALHGRETHLHTKVHLFPKIKYYTGVVNLTSNSRLRLEKLELCLFNNGFNCIHIISHAWVLL